MKFAIPVAGGRLDGHFGHAREFALVETDAAGAVVSREDAVPPPHAPGVLPRWLAERGVAVVIAGGMGPRAVSLLETAGVHVVTGAPAETPEALVAAYHAGSLVASGNTCDHGPDHSHRSCGSH